MTVIRKEMLLLMAVLLWVSLSAGAQPKRLLGGDISLLPSYEEQGTVYKDYDGREVKLLPFLKSQGWNAMRVRLFVDPANIKHGIPVCLCLCSLVP